MATKKKLGGIKSLDKHTAEFNDETKIIDYNQDLVQLYNKAVVEALTNQKTNNYLLPFVNKSIKGMLNPDRTDLGVRSLDKLESLVKETTEYFQKHQEADNEFIEYKIDKTLFPWQKDVIKFDSKRNTLLCGRRSGKSYVESAIAVLHCTKGYDIVNGFKKPRSVLVMGLTSERVKDVFWENIKHYVEIANIPAKIDNSALSITFENGASIILKGNNSKVDREKLRGADYSLIIIDECQSQQSLGYLMIDILGPIIKGRDSFCFLSGTGAITNKGYWKDITDGKDSATWRHFTATMKDNPTIPTTALDDVLIENNWTPDNVTYRREYLAENITDTTRLIIPNFHRWDNLDGKIFDHLCIGIDYGFNDYNAIVALLKDTQGKIYEVETRKFNKSDVGKIVLNVKQVWEETINKYHIPIDNCICAADNSDQSISAEVQKNGVKIQNAIKVDKVQNIIDMKEALNRGDFLVHSEILTDEFESWVWKYDEENKTVIYEPDDDFFHPDAAFAAIYSWRYLKNK